MAHRRFGVDKDALNATMQTAIDQVSQLTH